MVALAVGDGTSTTAPVQRAARWWVDVVDTPDALEPHRRAWDDLACEALEPNPFYESWMLAPAWRLFGLDDGVQVAFVYRDGPRPQDPPELCGLFPLIQRRFGNWPITNWTLWQHQYGFCCTPLLRQGIAREALHEFWNWLEISDGPAVWELPLVPADGAFQQTLIDVANDRQSLYHVVQRYNRAMLRPAETAEDYCTAAMSCHNRQELRRKQRRLAERGRVEHRQSSPTDDHGSWIEQFLALEAAGWKGQEGTALATSPVDAAYFRAIVTAAASRRQVVFLGLFLDEQPIALKVNFLSGAGGFAFKIAFDESLSKLSPGVLLELDNIEWLHRQPGVKWMDSCAKPGHFMIDRLWSGRRTIKHLLMSTGRRWGDLAVGTIPFLQALKAVLQPRQRTTGDTP
jgi:hypothetical protein